MFPHPQEIKTVDHFKEEKKDESVLRGNSFSLHDIAFGLDNSSAFNND